jgi:TRAP-type C4-dicarboxylate transport system permease small subunit
MTKITKSLLALAVLGLSAGGLFNSGIIDVQNASAFYVALPAGAIFLGLFFISKMLEKESAAYDQEQRAALAAAGHAVGMQSATTARADVTTVRLATATQK